MYWNGWPWDRVLFLFTGLAFLLVGAQVTMFHYRQNFRAPSMWLPVGFAPVAGLAAILTASYNLPFLRTVLAVLSVAGAVSGIGGFILHFAGVGERVNGYRLDNFLTGPPVTLPLMVTALSALGLISLYWRW